MKRVSHLTWFLAVLLSLLLALPMPMGAQAKSAGAIARLVGSVNVQHGPRVQLASSGAKVYWGDRVTTLADGRARIQLDDGSILNVGSNSELRIVQHDAANQRTDLQLAYGRIRASAVRVARSGSYFQVRTPTAVAGVVGSGFDMSSINDIVSLSVTEGSVQLCNVATPPQCVTVAAGFTSTVRGNQAPSQPAATAPSTATENVQSTSVQGGVGAGAAGAGAGAASNVSVIVAVIGAIGAVGGIVGVSVGTSGQKCGCTTVQPGGGVANGRHRPN